MVLSLGQEDPLEVTATHFTNPMDRGAWRATVHGAAELNTGAHKDPCAF